MSRNRKKPKTSAKADAEKRAKHREDPNEFLQQHPVWKTQAMDMDDEWSWKKVSYNDICEKILPRLKSFETMSWNDIINQSHREHKFMDVEKLSLKAQKRLEKLRLFDVDMLFSFRLMGQPRLWGIVQENVFNMLWWDPLHTVYPTKKKHT